MRGSDPRRNHHHGWILAVVAVARADRSGTRHEAGGMEGQALTTTTTATSSQWMIPRSMGLLCPRRAPAALLWCPGVLAAKPLARYRRRPWQPTGQGGRRHGKPSRSLCAVSQLRPTPSSARIRLIDHLCSTYRGLEVAGQICKAELRQSRGRQGLPRHRLYPPARSATANCRPSAAPRPAGSASVLSADPRQARPPPVW
jgi:hypothetical protein